MVTDGRVMLISPTDYDNEISRLKHKFLANHADQLHSAAKAPFIKDARRKKLQSKKAAILRLQKLQLPASKRVTLHALKVPNGSCSPKLLTDPKDISQGLADAWRPVFQKKKIDVRKAQKYAQRFKSDWHWSLAQRPTKSNVERVMRRLPKTSSGPDGLPYCAWQQGGEEAIETLWQVTDAQCEGELPPRELNDSASLFVPKGALEEDHSHFCGQRTV